MGKYGLSTFYLQRIVLCPSDYVACAKGSPVVIRPSISLNNFTQTTLVSLIACSELSGLSG